MAGKHSFKVKSCCSWTFESRWNVAIPMAQTLNIQTLGCLNIRPVLHHLITSTWRWLPKSTCLPPYMLCLPIPSDITSESRNCIVGSVASWWWVASVCLHALPPPHKRTRHVSLSHSFVFSYSKVSVVKWSWQVYSRSFPISVFMLSLWHTALPWMPQREMDKVKF